MGWIFLLICLSFVNNIVSIVAIQNFITENPTISNDEAMQAYKTLVRMEMYLSIAQFVLLWGVVPLALYSLIVGLWGSTQLILVLALGAAVFAADRVASKNRQEVRSLPAADKGLEGLYNAISQIWVTKTLPDF